MHARSTRSATFVVSVASLLAFALSCGGGGGASSTKGPSSAPTTNKISAAGATEDRSPVEAPEGLFFQLHTTAPRAIAHSLKPALGMTIDPRQVIGSVLDDPTMAQLVDVDQPVDVAVVVQKGDKDPIYAAYAFGMEEGGDWASIVGKSYKVEPKSGGVVRLKKAKSGNYDFKEDECWIFPSNGPSLHRLVCALGPNKALDFVGPWLARGVTQRSWPDALGTVELDVRPARNMYGDELAKVRDEASGEVQRLASLGKPALDKALSKIAKQTIDELFDLFGDVDTFTLSLKRKTSAFELDTSVNFGRAVSWTARATLANAEGTGGAPAMLGKVPADGVRSAVFAHPGPTSEALLQPWQAAMLQLVEATAVDYGWAKKDEDSALELVRAMFPRVADGFSFTGGDSSTWGEGPKDESKKGRKWLWQRLSRPDWTISEVERDAKPTRDELKALAAVMTSPSFAATVKKMSDGSYVLKTTSKTGTPKGLKDATSQTFDITLIGTEPDLPSEEVDVSAMPAPPPPATSSSAIAKPAGKPAPKSPPKTAKKPKKETVLFHIGGEAIVVAAGARSWTAWGWNVPEKDLVDRLQHAMAGDSSATLSQRTAFDFLLSPNASSGAWIDLSEAASGLGSKNASSAAPSADDAMAWRVTAQKNGNGGSATIELLLRDEAIGIGAKAADEVDVPWF